MKSLSLGLIALVNCIALSQPIPEWTSPQGRDSVSIGWTDVSTSPPGIRFFQMDRTSIRIMSGAYSTTPAITIPLAAAEADQGGLYPFFMVYGDMSGDGVSDILLYRRYGSYPYRYGFRIVNPITGQDIFLFDDPNYSYTSSSINDLDGDGFVELAVARQTYPPPRDNAYELLVFQTARHTTSVGTGSSKLPASPMLRQNFPNPFNPATRIQYDVSKPGTVAIEIVDVNGRLVRRFSEQPTMPGQYEVAWDGRDASGLPAATGTYFYRLLSEGSSSAKKMILLK
jgi:hypothetical protein